MNEDFVVLYLKWFRGCIWCRFLEIGSLIVYLVFVLWIIFRLVIVYENVLLVFWDFYEKKVIGVCGGIKVMWNFCRKFY